MKLKKVLIGLFTLLLAVSLVACKNGGGTNTPEKSYTIAFEVNEGSEVASITAKAGEAITKPADPTKENLTFGGWCSDIDLTEDYEFPATMPAEDVTLYAKWVVTLTFDSKGGPEIAPIVGEGGKTYKMPEEPLRDGYVFVGWFTDQNYTNKLSYVMPRTNTTAYAKWQVYEVGSAITVPMEFSDNDGVYQMTTEEDGIKFTATSGKKEWSYCAAVVPVPATNNTTIVVELVGTKDIPVTLKLEGGNAPTTETTVTMTGEAQTVIWTSAEPLSSVSGFKFLFFLNGGITGCGETPEYVKIKSVKLYRTVDADATQKSAIHFATNGGDDIEPLYDVAGADVSAPTDPVRGGYNFAGWYSDAALENAYTFSKMPQQGLVVYAKWDKSTEIKQDIEISLENGTKAEDSKITATYENEMLTISKGEGAVEYEWYALPFPQGADASGYDHLRVAFQGPAGQKMLFKVNDQNGAGELFVDCTGEVQVLDLVFDIKFNMSAPAITLMPNAGTPGASGQFKIMSLALGNYPALYDIIKEEGWVSPTNESGEPNTKTSFKVENGVMTIAKEAGSSADYNWDCVKYMATENLVGFNVVQVVLQGTKGEEVLIKVYDSKEKFVTLTGEVQNIVIEYDLDYKADKPALVLFANPNAAGTGHDIKFYTIQFIQEPKASAPVNPQPAEGDKEDVDLLDNPTITKNGHEYSTPLVVSKVVGGGNWEWLGLKVDADLTGYTKVVVTVQGTEGEIFLVKPNDNSAGEARFTMDGTLKTFEKELPAGFTWDANKATMVFMPDADVTGKGHDFIITKFELQGEGKDPIDLLAGTLSKSDACTARNVLVITKPTTNTGVWDSFWLEVEEDITGHKAVKYVVQGTAGEKLLIKVNDQLEYHVTLTGEVQEGVLDLTDKTLEAGKKAMILFANAGSAGTGNPITIYELKYLVELPE